MKRRLRRCYRTETAIHKSVTEGAGGLLRPVSSLHMRVLSSGNFTQHDCSMDSFGGLLLWLRVTRVAMVRPFGLVLGRC